MIGRRRTPDALDCRAVGRLLQAYLDDELGDPRAVAVADHLDACLACGMDAVTYRWLKAELAGLARADDPRQVERVQAFAEALASGSAG
jgi:anti-sigma factor RsiW